jgi:TPR repeat protein
MASCARWRSHRVAACLALALLAGSLHAQGSLEDGLAAYRDGDYAKAAQLWRPLADKGDAEAQYRLGSMYAEGKGVERNDATALMWFQRAAERGNAAAQYNVGASYATGVGVEKNDAEAAKWFRRAADQGMAFAELNLGLLYAAGHGVPQDNVEAMTWLQLSLFALPPGGARSDVARAMQDISAKMTSEQLQDAKDRARTWKAKPEGK